MNQSDIISCAAAFISLLALTTTIWQGYISRKHNIMSIKPSLGFEISLALKGAPITFKVKNNGLGPAIVKSFRLITKDKQIEYCNINEVKTTFGDLGIDLGGISWGTMFIDQNEYISPNESHVFLEFPDAHKNALIHDDLIIKLSNVGFSIDYECIYGYKYNAILDHST